MLEVKQGFPMLEEKQGFPMLEEKQGFPMLEEKQGFPQIIEEVAAWFDPAAIFRFQRAWPQFHAGLRT